MKNESGKGLSTANPSVKGSVPTKTPSVKSGAPAGPGKTPSVASAKMPAGDTYEAEQHHRTLMEAEHIKADPVKMMKVRQVSGRKLQAASAIHKIADIKMAAKKLRAGKISAGADSGDAPVATGATSGRDEEGEGYHTALAHAEMIKSDPRKMAAVRTVSGAKAKAAANVHAMVGDNDADDKA